MANIRTWRQTSGIEIDEVEFDGDRHAFEVCVDGRHVVTVYADSPEDTEVMRLALDLGGDVRDWVDGNGNYVGTLIRQRTDDGLRETLRRIEDAGTCYNSRLCKGLYGTLWIDKVNDIYYKYETDDMDLLVDDLTDDDLLEVRIGGI